MPIQVSNVKQQAKCEWWKEERRRRRKRWGRWEEEGRGVTEKLLASLSVWKAFSNVFRSMRTTPVLLYQWVRNFIMKTIYQFFTDALVYIEKKKTWQVRCVCHFSLSSWQHAISWLLVNWGWGSKCWLSRRIPYNTIYYPLITAFPLLYSGLSAKFWYTKICG